MIILSEQLAFNARYFIVQIRYAHGKKRGFVVKNVRIMIVIQLDDNKMKSFVHYIQNRLTLISMDICIEQNPSVYPYLGPAQCPNTQYGIIIIF